MPEQKDPHKIQGTPQSLRLPNAFPNIKEKVRLSPRELQCLTWVAAGYSAENIATEIGIDMNTVIFHLKNCRKKLHSKNTQEAVTKALLKGIIQFI